MYLPLLLSTLLAATSMAVPEQLEKRQQSGTTSVNIEDLVANPGDITIPTDPAAISSLAEAAPGIIENLDLEPSALGELVDTLPTEYLELAYSSVDALLDQAGFTATGEILSAIPTEYQSLLGGFLSYQATADGGAAANTAATGATNSPVPTEAAEEEDDDEDFSASTTVTAVQTTLSGDNEEATTSRATTLTTSSARVTGNTSTTATARPASVTSNPAAKPTGAMAAGLAGVIGVLGAVAIL